MVLLSVHQTHEEGAATKRLSTAARLKSKRLRDILGMKHRESIYVWDAKISWNAFLWNSDFLGYHNSLSLDVQVGVQSCTNIHHDWLEFIVSLSIEPQHFFFP